MKGFARLPLTLVVILFCLCLKTGLSDPYCEVSMGSQEQHTKVVPQTLNPKWNSTVGTA